MLTQVAGTPVCPSDDVDQAWHLHITRTADYERFCREVPGRFLHHHPAESGADEQQRHRAMYASTLSQYRRAFRASPPPDIWPGVERRFAEPPAAPAVIRLAGPFATGPFLAVVALAAVVAAAMALNLLGVLDATHAMRGPAFLLLAMPVTLALAFLGWLSTLPPRRQHPGDTLDIYEAAWLAGGSARVAATAIGLLVDRGTLALRRTPSGARGRLAKASLVAAQEPVPTDLHPLELACLAALRRGELTFDRAHAALAPACERLRERLRRAGLAGDEHAIAPARAAMAAVVAAWLVVELERILHALATPRPMGFLVMLTLAGTGLLLALVLRIGRDTWRGRRALQKLGNTLPARGAASVRTDASLLPLTLALLGPAALLAHPGLSGLDDVLGPHGMRQSSGSIGTSGCGSSGCGNGGCGGGGCGG